MLREERARAGPIQGSAPGAEEVGLAFQAFRARDSKHFL